MIDPDRNAAIRRMRDMGMTQKDIGIVYNISPGRVGQILKIPASRLAAREERRTKWGDMSTRAVNYLKNLGFEKLSDVTISDLAPLHGIGPGTICEIKRGIERGERLH